MKRKQWQNMESAVHVRMFRTPPRNAPIVRERRALTELDGFSPGA